MLLAGAMRSVCVREYRASYCEMSMKLCATCSVPARAVPRTSWQQGAFVPYVAQASGTYLRCISEAICAQATQLRIWAVLRSQHQEHAHVPYKRVVSRLQERCTWPWS